ncbi:MAG: hypothetical protein MJ208_03040 [Bacilli bacterium]|nr:hypothetical protein [Bacilli bacterium]
MKKHILFLLPFIVIPSLIACNQTDEFTAMRKEYCNYLLETSNYSDYKDKTADEIKQEVESKEISGIETYFFPDIDYEYCYERQYDTWYAINHLHRTFKITLTAAARHDNNIKDIAIKLTYFWVFNNFRHTNWFNTELDADSKLSDIAMFIYDDLNEKGQAMLRGRIAETSFYHRQSILTHTGSNLFDYVNTTLKSAILSHNSEELELAITRAEQEINDEGKEGFQKDGSFFQHGRQLQTTSYGKSVMRLGKIMRIIAKSNHRFDQSKLAIISRYILRGLRSVTHKGYLNYCSGGRDYVRRGSMTTNDLSGLSLFLDTPNFPDIDQLKQYIDDINNKRSTFNGIVYFDDAKMVAMNIDDLYISFEGSSPDITNTECVSDENYLGLNLSYGTNTCIMDQGDEYYNIAALWDYSYIPGTTSLRHYSTATESFIPIEDLMIYNIITNYYLDALYEQTLPKPIKGGDYIYNSGYDSTNNIACFMQKSCHHKENYFTVTAVACEDGLVLLGADLKYTGAESGEYIDLHQISHNLHTTLQQCMANGKEQLSEDKLSLTCGNAFYRSLDGQEIITKKRHIKSKELRNRRLYNIPDLGKDVEGDTFLAYIQHDLKDDDGAKYAYSIQPTTKKDRQFIVRNNFKNGIKVQEIELPNGKTVVAAYQKVENYKLHNGKIIELLNKGDFLII